MYISGDDMIVMVGKESEQYGNGKCFLESNHKAFRERFGKRIEDIVPGKLYAAMNEVAFWANNEINVGCIFCMF